MRTLQANERFDSVVEGDIEPLEEKILVHNLDIAEKVTKTGIIIPTDDAKDRGIKPRWAQVYAVGQKITEVSVGEWVLLEHGRWTRGIKLIKKDGTETIVRMVDRNCVLMASDEKPLDV